MRIAGRCAVDEPKEFTEGPHPCGRELRAARADIAQDGRFTVVERRKVNTVMKEQDFAASNRVKQGTGARIGQIRGADLTLMGDIVVFGRDDRRVSGAAGAVVPGAGGVAGGYRQTNKAVVVLDYRIVDTETGRPLPEGQTGVIQIRGPHILRGICRRSHHERQPRGAGCHR